MDDRGGKGRGGVMLCLAMRQAAGWDGTPKFPRGKDVQGW